jgi:hypothetical protein
MQGRDSPACTVILITRVILTITVILSEAKDLVPARPRPSDTPSERSGSNASHA